MTEQDIKALIEKHGTGAAGMIVAARSVMRSRSVTMLDDHAEYATKIGGTVSAGVRIALEAHKATNDSDDTM